MANDVLRWRQGVQSGIGTSMPRAPIFTIGHSNRAWEELVDALERYQIGFVVDLRTKPYSSRNPHFNMEVLAQSLPRVEIKYLFLGKELGARRTEPHLLSDIGQVSYPQVRQTPEFKSAIARIEKGSDDGYRLGLLCSEGEPLYCHRFPMIAYQLVNDGFEVQHILRDGSLKTHAEIEAELLARYANKIPQPGLFDPGISTADQLEAAYDQLNLAIGWKEDRPTDADH
jgi:uncharacterized protein (DUF488 family)